YCAGLTYMSRGRLSEAGDNANWQYEQAVNEITFVFKGIEPTHRLWGEVATTLGMAYRGMKNYPEAEDYIGRSMHLAPGYLPAYSAMAMVLRDQSKLKEGREVLLKGDKAGNGQSAEIHYFLGLVSLDLGDVATARTQADQAYALGYPLPGLK